MICLHHVRPVYRSMISRKRVDLIALTEIDKSNESLLGEMGAIPWKGAEIDLVFEDDTLTCGQVAGASTSVTMSCYQVGKHQNPRMIELQCD